MRSRCGEVGVSRQKNRGDLQVAAVLCLIFCEEFDGFAYLCVALILREGFTGVDMMDDVFLAHAFEGTAGSLYLGDEFHAVLRLVLFEKSAERTYLPLSTAEAVE